jgi:hypothetical protein
VCSGQQESGSVCIASRGDDGQITFREWHPVGVEEYGYVAPDPLDPDIVYGGKVSRFDRRTGQVQNVSPPRTGAYRTLRTAPVLFSSVDPKLLLFASNVVWKTLDGGRNWTAISPDLTRATWDVPASVGVYATTPAARPSQRGVVYTLAPSYKDANVIWAGTDDGLIHVTMDGGKTWKDVTPPDLKPWMKVSIIDAGRFDAQIAYAAINTFRIDDLRPHIYRTRDGGKTWTHITAGIPDGAVVNVVREDSQRKGLLFAGTEREVYVSFDEGERWQSLRLNMPATSIRDLVIKDNDVVVGTHGRSFWILDDIAPLRQYTPQAAQADVFLFKPSDAIRVRWNMNTDTPLPPDEPAGQNPPDGAIIDYQLKTAATGPVTLDVADSAGQVIRTYSSTDTADPIRDEGNVPRYCQQRSYPIAAIAGNTPKLPVGPWVPPGTYTVKLTVDGRSYTQPLTVKMDPRVKTAPADLTEQFTLSKRMYDGMKRISDALGQMRARGGADAAAERGLMQVHAQLSAVLNSLQGADMPPTRAMIDDAAAAERALAGVRP